MKSVWVILVWSLVTTPAFAGEAASDTLNAPSFSLMTVAGQPVNFSSGGHGKPALILFWATWCPYCRALMPEIQKLRDAYGEEQLDLFAINVFDDDGDPVAYMKKYGYTYQLLFSGDEVAADYGVKGTPGLFLVANDGHIAYKRISGTKPEQARLAIIKALTELGVAIH